MNLLKHKNNTEGQPAMSVLPPARHIVPAKEDRDINAMPPPNCGLRP